MISAPADEEAVGEVYDTGGGYSANAGGGGSPSTGGGPPAHEEVEGEVYDRGVRGNTNLLMKKS